MSSSIAAVLRRSGLRASVLRPLSLAPRLSAAALTPVKVEASARSLCPASMTSAWSQVRCYSGADPLNMQFIKDRYMLKIMSYYTFLFLCSLLTQFALQSHVSAESL